MGSPFVHIELTTTDINKSKSFYKSLFDWKLEDIDMQGGQTYTMIKVGEGTGGGMFQMAGAPAMWLPYVLVDDVKKTTEKAKSLGAKVVRDVTEIPNMGWFSILSDPSGAMIALWQASARS